MVVVDIILTGLIIGGMYALIALGLTLQYGVARIMNLAYGEFFVAAALGAFWLYTGVSLSPLVGLGLILPVAFVLNWAIYQILLVPLVRRAKNQGMLEVDSILATFGLLFAIQGVALAAFIIWRRKSIAISLRHVRTVPFLLYCWILTVLYSVTFSAFANFGLLDRQRALVLPALYVLLCLDSKKAREFDDERNNRLGLAVGSSVRGAR